MYIHILIVNDHDPYMPETVQENTLVIFSGQCLQGQCLQEQKDMCGKTHNMCTAPTYILIQRTDSHSLSQISCSIASSSLVLV